MTSILKFKPIFKNKIWGGDRIARFKNIAASGEAVGESWEVSPLHGDESLVVNGQFAGASLSEMIASYGADIMGERLFCKYGSFPLLIKLIDSADDLSIQVHPDDTLAQERHRASGKTEMWYSLGVADGAYLYAGFSRRVSRALYKKCVKDGSIIDYLHRHQVNKGDVFYLPAGRVHSIGRGNLILEVQEASDITYRLYDYNRTDTEGRRRPLHLEEAEEAIDFDDISTERAQNITPPANGTAQLCRSPYFTVEVNNIEGQRRFDFSRNDSFTVLAATEGEFILDMGGQAIPLRQGETALLPWSKPRLLVGGSGNLVSIYVG